MNPFYFLFLIASSLFAAYCDDELERLRASIADIHSPTLEEYRSIEHYLSTGQRSYLAPLRESDRYSKEKRRMNSILNFKLVGPNGEMPIWEIYHFNTTEETKKRCILLYGTYNSPYPDKARQLLSEVKECGYSGDVLLRIGGFPNTQFGGLNICHVPYAWKVAFLQEARLLGYKEILWIDLAIHPMKNFDHIFSLLQEKGYFFTSVGSLQNNFSTHLPQAAEALQINTDFYDQISHIWSAIIALNMGSAKAVRLLENWYKETENVYPNITWWPEELSLSVVAWRLGCRPYTWLGNLVCAEGELFQIQNRPGIEFYIDARR